MEKKYELTSETIDVFNKKLYRIRALKDFGNVKKGDLGGFVESENNLSQEGNCWVSGNAKVYDNAEVYGCAEVYGYANITKTEDYIVITPVGSENGVLTAYKTDNGIECNRGCFKGTLEEFEERVKEVHKDNKYGRQYLLLVPFIKERLS